MATRNLSVDENRILEFLINKAGNCLALQKDWKVKLLVEEMDDGGMGGLKLFPEGMEPSGRKFGRQVSDCQFTDLDGVEVIVSLNLDQFDSLYELDFWKTNFCRVLKIPDSHELREVNG